MPPAFLRLPTEAEYRTHFEAKYCSGPILTFEGIPVFFSKNKFDHAFFESTRRDGAKDQFSTVRAERMDWIEYALQEATATRYQGWHSQRGRYDPTRQVTVVVNDFVVIIRMKMKRDGSLKAEFVTCYQADNSIGKIHRSPLWDLNRCRSELSKKKGR